MFGFFTALLFQYDISGYLCVSFLIMLIFFSKFSISYIIEPPPPAAARSLVMIAKCLQNLANLVEFGAKESYMEVVNPFILKNKERMVVFLDHLSVSYFPFVKYCTTIEDGKQCVTDNSNLHTYIYDSTYIILFIFLKYAKQIFT